MPGPSPTLQPTDQATIGYGNTAIPALVPSCICDPNTDFYTLSPGLSCHGLTTLFQWMRRNIKLFDIIGIAMVLSHKSFQKKYFGPISLLGAKFKSPEFFVCLRFKSCRRRDHKPKSIF